MERFEKPDNRDIHIEETKKAAFNLALASLDRINNLLTELVISYKQGDKERMRLAINNLHMEIRAKLKIKEREVFDREYGNLLKMKGEYSKKQLELRKYIHNPLPVIDATKKRNQKLLELKSLNGKYWKQLCHLNIILRSYLEYKGMLIPTTKDSRFMEGAL